MYLWLTCVYLYISFYFFYLFIYFFFTFHLLIFLLSLPHLPFTSPSPPSLTHSLQFQWCNRDPRCKKLQLTDLLVAPVQHIMKVPLILRDIEARTEQPQERAVVREIIEAEEHSLSKSANLHLCFFLFFTFLFIPLLLYLFTPLTPYLLPFSSLTCVHLTLINRV